MPETVAPSSKTASWLHVCSLARVTAVISPGEWHIGHSMCPQGHVCVSLCVWDVCRNRDHIVPLLLLDILRGRKEWEEGRWEGG